MLENTLNGIWLVGLDEHKIKSLCIETAGCQKEGSLVRLSILDHRPKRLFLFSTGTRQECLFNLVRAANFFAGTVTTKRLLSLNSVQSVTTPIN